jgi:hypothetical protein
MRNLQMFGLILGALFVWDARSQRAHRIMASRTFAVIITFCPSVSLLV